MQVTLLGVPFNGDGTTPEAENPAQALRQAGLGPQLGARGHAVRDLGDLAVPPFEGSRDPVTQVLNQAAWRQITEELAARLQGLLDRSELPLLLGGDCAVLTGVCAALRALQPPVRLVYLDGHADYRWPTDSPTGEPADLVLTALTGRIPGLFAGVTPGSPLIREADVTVFGLRDRDRIDESTIRTCDCEQMRQAGVARIVEAELGGGDESAGPVWLHFDVDVLDPGIMPGVLFPEPGGLSMAETGDFLQAVFATGRVLGVTVACYHPRFDRDLAGAQRIVQLLTEALPSSGP